MLSPLLTTYWLIGKMNNKSNSGWLCFFDIIERGFAIYVCRGTMLLKTETVK